MKKFILFLFTLVIGLAVFCGIKTKATGITLTMEDGASVRTEDPAGIRFIAEVNTLEGATEHGFYLAAGEHSLSAMETAIETNATLVGGNKLVKVPATGDDASFAVTIYGMDELSEYLQDITAIAYVKVGDGYTFDKAVTRNITEVSFGAVRNGRTGSILTTVTAAAKANYMVKSGSLNVFYEYTITELQTVKYGYSNLSALYANFLNDYNAATGASLTTECTDSEFYSSLKTGVGVNDWTIDPTDNIAKMFSGYNLTKWQWLLDYFSSHAAGVHISNQANALLSIGRTAASYKLHSMEHLVYSFWNFFHTTTINSPGNGYIPNKFANEAAYSSVVWPEVTDFNDENVVAVGDTITLPSAPVRNGYSFVKYNDGTNDYTAGDSYTITSSKTTISSIFNMNTYTITYELNGGTNSGSNPSTYTVVTDNITLQDATKAGKVFKGWYTTSDFSSARVYSIPKGSYGNIKLYAKFVDPITLGYVDDDWAELAPGTDVTVLGNHYTIGDDAFATIGAALDAAGDDATIKVLAGTYNGNASISSSGMNLIGPNNNISAVNGVRNDEAIITGVISVSPGLSDISIYGFKFTGAGQVYVTSSDSGSTVHNIRGFNYKYNYVDKGSDTTAAVLFADGNRQYSDDIVIEYCYFTAPKLAEIVEGKSGLVYTNNNVNITVKNCKFYNIPLNAVGCYDTTNGKGAAGDIIFENNTFIDITKGAIWIQYNSPLSGSDHIIKIKGNYLENVGGAAGIDFEGAKAGDVYASARVEENVFKNVFKCLWVDKITGVVFTNNAIYEYSSPTTAYVVKGVSGYNINCERNLYIKSDGTVVTTVYSTDGSTGFIFNARTTNVDKNNYDSKEAYNAAGLTYTIE